MLCSFCSCTNDNCLLEKKTVFFFTTCIVRFLIFIFQVLKQAVFVRSASFPNIIAIKKLKMTSLILTVSIDGKRRCVPGISMMGQPLKYWENSSALRVALIRMIFRSGRLGSMSLRYIIKKSLWRGNYHIIMLIDFIRENLYVIMHKNGLHKILHCTVESFIFVVTDSSGLSFN